jgi:hypothetical protein
VSVAGATIEDDTGLMKVKDETMNAAIHFLRLGQLRNIRVRMSTGIYDLLILAFWDFQDHQDLPSQQ